MDLQLLIDDFFNNVPIEDLIKKYNIKYPRLCGIIKQYCIQNNIDFNDEIKKKLELPMDEIYNQKKERTTYKEIAKKYGCSDTMIKNYLDEYCQLNNLKTPDIERAENLSIEEIYKKKKNGQTVKSIGEEYNYSPTFISKKISNYCEQEGLPYLEERTSVEEMYELRKMGKSYKQIGAECGYNEVTVSKYIEIYCAKKGIEVPGYMYTDMPIEEMYELRKKGKSYKQIGVEYGYNEILVSKYIKRYCAEKGIEVPKYMHTDMPIEEIYTKKVNGSTYQNLSKEYGYNRLTLSKYLVQYCIENEIDPSVLKGKLPINQIFEARKEDVSYVELSSKYSYSCGFLNEQVINYCVDSISQLNKMLKKEYMIKFLLDLKLVLINAQNNNLENNDIVFLNKK